MSGIGICEHPALFSSIVDMEITELMNKNSRMYIWNFLLVVCSVRLFIGSVQAY